MRSLLEVDLKRLLNRIERLCRVELPKHVVEVSLVERLGVLHIRFGEPRSYELGEPIHPLIHLYRDSETNEVTALEIIDIDALLTELGRDEKREAQQHAR